MQATQATADRILDIAEALVQVRGFNGFSYADVAQKLDVTKPSIHYHFATKADLGQRLIERYRERFLDSLQKIERTEKHGVSRLQGYAALYAGVLRDKNRMCLCGMLAAEYHTLPEGVREEVISFFDENEAWLARMLLDGRERSELSFDGPPELKGRLLLSSLEGAMLVARSYQDVERFDRVAARLIADLVPVTEKKKIEKKKKKKKKKSKPNKAMARSKKR